MTILGFSDAKLSVLKFGGDEVRAQGFLASHLGDNVCPKIYHIGDCRYEMELLEPPRSRSVIQLAEVVQRLRSDVWPRDEFQLADETFNERWWLKRLIVWAHSAPWLRGPIIDVYKNEPKDGYCLIHGDPALSNLMRRGEHLIIADPMPRLEYRAEIPNRREVDMGKLVQSACGWERILGCEGSTLWNEPETALKMFAEEDRKPAALWGAIHLARVAIRALPRGKSRIAEWAVAQSQMLVRSYV